MLRIRDKEQPSGLLDEINADKGMKLSWMTHAGPPQNFRHLAVALLCTLDVALSWTPVDPFCWMGKPDTVSIVMARKADIHTFQEFAEKLGQSVKLAWSSRNFWQRFETHLDSMRKRTLEESWTRAWTLRESASMLVRNRTKVPLRVELHRPQKPSTPLSDCFVQPLLDWCLAVPEPLLVAEVNPGIEWALRPKKEEGRDFQVQRHENGL